MNNQEFLFLFDAVLLNTRENRQRQGRLLSQAVRQGHINLDTAVQLRQKHIVWCSEDSLRHAHHAYLLSTSAPNLDDQLDRQQIPEPPGEFEQDPTNPCGALDPRF